MNKIVLCGMLLFLFAWVGCGGDDDSITEPPVVEKDLKVASASSAPSMASVDDPQWNNATSLTVSLSSALLSPAFRQPNRSTLAVAKDFSVKGLVYADTLYLRFEWADASFSGWRDRFAVTGFDVILGENHYLFAQDTLSFKEDELMIMFQEGSSTSWDVWQWRLLTTGAGSLAEGFNYDGTELTKDAGSFAVATTNAENQGTPIYMHFNSPLFKGNVLLDTDTIPLSRTLAWEVGDALPGWIIDTSLANPNRVADADSRFDIRAVSTYSSGRHKLVLARALNTGHADDFQIAAPSTVNIRVGITNDLDFLFGLGDSDQGFTGVFKMVLP